MAAEKTDINQFLELAKHSPVIDVRSPGEYLHAHIPGAHSLPLFTNEERAHVGTTYKQQSREAAIRIGLDYFGPKMRTLVETCESLVNSHLQQESETDAGSGGTTTGSRQILVYCWRGGMRSEAVSWLLDLYGFKVFTLIGGYKKFRNLVLDTFKKPFRFHILGGYTGSGKTELLRSLKEKGEKVTDLEGLASHKGSAFGNIGMPAQPSQEMFENRLALELLSHLAGHEPGPIWLEDESQRIGHVNLPNELWSTMRQSDLFFLDIPFEERLKHLVEEYGALDKIKMLEAIGRIRDKLGGLNAKNAASLLESGNTLESFRILLNYYDRFYSKGLHNRENLNSLLHKVECNSVTAENAIPIIQYTRQKVQEN